MQLYNVQYDIDPTKDWHRDYQTYISDYGGDGKKISMLCVEYVPILKDINQYTQLIEQCVTFIKRQHFDFECHLIAFVHKKPTPEVFEATEHLLQQLGSRVIYRAENELLDKLINLNRYQKIIIQEFEQDILLNTNLTLADMYVPLSGAERIILKQKLEQKEDGDIPNVEQFILDWVKTEKSNTREHLAVLGQYGQGKTVLATKLVKEILAAPETYQRIPILINLRGLSPRNMDRNAIFAQWSNRFRGEVQALAALHRAGKLLLILDGFDEMDLVGDTEILFQHFAQLWGLANTPKSKIIILGRPNLFADDLERRDALGIIPPQSYGAYTKAIYLHPLSPPQIAQALRKVPVVTQQEILSTLKQVGQDSSFAELIARPSTLYQLSTVWDKELAKQKDRLNSAEVIGKFIDKTYDRQDHKDGATQATFLTTLERNYFMMGIAVGMMRNNQYANQIKHNQLIALVRQLWEHYPEALLPYQRATQVQKIKRGNLKKRLKENLYPLETILRDVRVGGILVEDVSGRDVFKFAHKSYLEYLVSAFYAHFLLQKQEDKIALMKANSIAQALNFKQTELAPSKDVERFTAEHIVANMELSDKAGNTIPLKGNEEQYQKAIYKKVILHWHRRMFPNLMGWLTLHPAQKWLMGIMVCSLISLFFILTTNNEVLQKSLAWFNGILYLSIWGVISYYKLHLAEKNIEKVFVPATPYGVYIRLYAQVCWLLHIKLHPIKDNYYRLMMCSTEQSIYRLIIISWLNIFIFLSAIVTVAGAGVVTVAGVLVLVLAGAVAGTLAVAGAGTLVGAVAIVLAEAGAGALALALALALAMLFLIIIQFRRNLKKLQSMDLPSEP